MPLLREWIQRLASVFRRQRTGHDLEEELRSHLALAEEDLRRRGASASEAHRTARIQAGGAALAIESLRDQRGVPWLDDMRHGLRALWRSPSFTAVAVLTLALGIGANTAIFSIVSSVILRPPGYPQPEQLVYFTTAFPGLGFPEFWVSPPEYLEFREMNQSFASVGAFRLGEASLTADSQAQQVSAAFVDQALLDALGLQPARGRLFTAAETESVGAARTPEQSPTQQRLAVLSYSLWQSAFAGRPVIGESIEVDSVAREVIGVMPPGADLLDNRIQVWLPLGLRPSDRRQRADHCISLVGRLRPGITLTHARAELDALMANWAERVSVDPTEHVFSPLASGEETNDPRRGHILEMKPLQEQILGAAGQSIWLLQAAVGLVLLIACGNLASLLLARAETRRRELAIRSAIGASRSRLVRQFIAEGLLLSTAGAALGLVLAYAGVEALLRAYPQSLPRMAEISVDAPALLFTAGLAVLTGLLFGLAPLVYTRLKRLAHGLKDDGARGATGGSRQTVRGMLVAGEIALAIMLLTAAGLMIRTVYNLTTADAGFDRARLITFSVDFPSAVYPENTERVQAYQRMLRDLRAVPGVESASAMSGLPPQRGADATDTDIENYTAPPEGPLENVDFYQYVLDDYFETMGIPIVEGRGFQATDVTSGPVAVINETLAKTFWRDQNPIGRRLRPCCGDEPHWFTIVGIAKDVKQAGVDQQAGAELYLLAAQTAPLLGRSDDPTHIVLRTALPIYSLAPTVEGIVRQIDRSVPVVRLRDMDGVFAESIRRPRLLAQLLGAFATLALLLAAIGAYGILSYSVAQRRREIGIRMALGAARATVLAQVLRQGLALTLAGIAAGIAGAFALRRLIASLLFGVEPADAGTLVAVVATMLVVATLTCYLPASRAARLDPIKVLRES